MKASIYLVLEAVAFIGSVIAFSTNSIEYTALMISFVALFGTRRLEAKLEEENKWMN
ncbi:hypothetical protein [Salinicoccus halodurans]|uniref:Uncharacterized protein n=1 Tax=Salinicoccus halodurans TaxID=407035 RepID=A0AA94HID2_9STAP|nr:hypothetical protein [Salinicoccus halodurans]SFK95149.1 hypothetical protein SAMN05216235_2718 [Salinicoccus halodurans]